MAALQARWPGVDWVGCVGVGVAASGVEYFDEPALVLMLSGLPRERFEVFSGAKPLTRIAPFAALVHADPVTPDLPELIAEMSARTSSGYLFGGLAASRSASLTIAGGVLHGGLSGVAFGPGVGFVSRVTQGCQPLGPMHRITGGEQNLVHTLDGEPALAVLLRELQISDLSDQRRVLPRLQATLAGLSDAGQDAGQGAGQGAEPSVAAAPSARRSGQFGTEVRVRHLVGIDPGRGAVALADRIEPGMQLAFCGRDRVAARRDLVRICSEIRDEVESGPTASSAPARMRGAIYISCSGRGGPHFGGPSAELQIIRHALGDVPLAGFFAAGEIGHRQLLGYTGVLTVFVDR
jgi:small ligand-binding sensory domain FIST